MSACIAPVRNFDVNFARRSSGINFGDVVRLDLGERFKVVGLLGYAGGRDSQILPQVFTEGSQPPPLFQERKLAGQMWPGAGWRYLTGGVILNGAVTNDWLLAGGLFRSTDEELGFDEDLYLVTTPSQIVSYVLDGVPPLRSSSTSGEIRLSRSLSLGPAYGEIQLVTRGRSVTKAFGGDAVVDLGRHSIDDPSSIATPSIMYAATDTDHVRQINIGANFSARLPGTGWINAGFQRASYDRRVSIPGFSPVVETTAPWLPTLSVGVEAGLATLYSSFTRGLEDSAIAPPNASNRGTPPTTTTTSQIDGGLRLTFSPGQQLVIGGFEVRKTYFSLDAASVYRQVGNIRHTGLEASFNETGSSGATFIVGGVFVKPTVRMSGAALSPPIVSPLGTVPVTLNASLDYAPPTWGGWAGNMQWNFLTRRPSTLDGSEHLPAFSAIGLGVRYKARFDAKPITLALDVLNVTDTRGLHISSVGAILPEMSRRVVLSISADL